MEETKIKKRLESLPGMDCFTVQVVNGEESVLIILNRMEPEHPDYGPIVDQIVDEMELNCDAVGSIQFYSRILGEHEPDWSRTVSLGPKSAGHSTVIISSARSAPTVIESYIEEDPPRVAPSVTKVIDNFANSATTIEEEVFNLPKPKLPVHTPPEEEVLNLPKPKLSDPTPPEDEDNSAPTEVAFIPPRPKPKVEPIVEPVAAPFPVQNLVIAVVAIVGLLSIGWFAWSRLGPDSTPRPKRSEIPSIQVSPVYQQPITHV